MARKWQAEPKTKSSLAHSIRLIYRWHDIRVEEEEEDEEEGEHG